MMNFNNIAERVSGTNERQLQLLTFLIKLNIFAIPLYTILLLDLSFVPLQRFVADVAFSLLNSAGFNPAMNDLLISIPIKNGSWGAFINWDCTGWKSLLAFSALIPATTRATKMKALGLAIFLPLIFIVNIARIFFMYFYVRTFDIAYYDVVHGIVWSWGMIIAVLVFWTIWMKKTNI